MGWKMMGLETEGGNWWEMTWVAEGLGVHTRKASWEGIPARELFRGSGWAWGSEALEAGQAALSREEPC